MDSLTTVGIFWLLLGGHILNFRISVGRSVMITWSWSGKHLYQLHIKTFLDLLEWWISFDGSPGSNRSILDSKAWDINTVQLLDQSIDGLGHLSYRLLWFTLCLWDDLAGKKARMQWNRMHSKSKKLQHRYFYFLFYSRGEPKKIWLDAVSAINCGPLKWSWWLQLCDRVLLWRVSLLLSYQKYLFHR